MIKEKGRAGVGGGPFPSSPGPGPSDVGGGSAEPPIIALGGFRRPRGSNALHRNGKTWFSIASPVSEGVSREKGRASGCSVRDRGAQNGPAQKSRLKPKKERTMGQASSRDDPVRPQASLFHRLQNLTDPATDPRERRGHQIGPTGPEVQTEEGGAGGTHPVRSAQTGKGGNDQGKLVKIRESPQAMRRSPDQAPDPFQGGPGRIDRSLHQIAFGRAGRPGHRGEQPREPKNAGSGVHDDEGARSVVDGRLPGPAAAQADQGRLLVSDRRRERKERSANRNLTHRVSGGADGRKRLDRHSEKRQEEGIPVERSQVHEKSPS